MDDDETKRCMFCNKETALAVFGIVFGLIFVAMGVDIIRRNRTSNQELMEGGTVDG